jgi:hypothetical protein
MLLCILCSKKVGTIVIIVHCLKEYVYNREVIGEVKIVK